MLIIKIKKLATYFSYNEPSSGVTERSLGTCNICALYGIPYSLQL